MPRAWKQRRFGYLSSLCSLTLYQNRNRTWISIHGCTCNHHSRLSRACTPVFLILYPPRLLSPVYIVTSLPSLILKPRCRRSCFTPTEITRILAPATIVAQSSPQQTPPILRRLRHPNVRLLVSPLSTSSELPSPVPFLRDEPRVRV